MKPLPHVAAALLALSLVVGCSGGKAPVAGGQAPDAAAISGAASAFMSAVIRGDSPGAMSLLTPRAVAQLQANQQRFDCLGLAGATYKVGEVRKAADDQAAVQLLVAVGVGPQAPQPSAQEELCCLLRRVDGRWLVCGVAADAGPGQQPNVINFEAAPAPPTGQAGQFVGTPATQPGASSASPPQGAPQTALAPQVGPQTGGVR